MKIEQRYNGTIIGGIFTVGSLLLTLTFIVPILSVLPGAFIESIISSIVDNEPYSKVGKATIIVLLVFFVITLFGALLLSRKKELDNGSIVTFMILEYFIIHSLGFYIYWAVDLNYRSDGQLIFLAISSFPISSFGFVIIGVLIDLIKIKSPNSKGSTVE